VTLTRERAARIARTSFYRLFTHLPQERIDSMRRGDSGRRLLPLAQRAVGRGAVAIKEGPAAGLLLSTDHLPLTHIQAYGLVRGVLEPAVQEALRRHVRAGATVFDVGANVGFFTLFAALLTGPAGRVESFEPSPVSAEAIRANARMNGYSHVRVHEVAVGAAGGAGHLLHVDEHSWSHLEDRGWHSRTKEVLDVPVIALDEEIAAGRLPRPDVVKIDVEGSEVAVLEGLRQTLRSARPVVICELHVTNREVDALLREAGYEVENLDGPTAVVDAEPWVHVLGRPPRA
jgi:FkbM family methyltransferase